MHGPLTNNNRWVYTLHGLDKPVDHLSAGGIMAASVAMIAALWLFVQTLGYFGQPNPIAAYKVPFVFENYFSIGKDPLLSGVPSAQWKPDEELIVDVSASENSGRLPPITQANLNASIKLANEMLARLKRLEANLVDSGFVPQSGTPVLNQYANEHPEIVALERARRAIVVIKASSQLADDHCNYGLNENECARRISLQRLDATPIGGTCFADLDAVCDYDRRYRTEDGSCNNPLNPRWGSAFTAYARMMFPRYADGIQAPRREREASGLPNPRTLSVSLIGNKDRTDVAKTLALVEWTQFVSHDVAYTPVRNMVWSEKPISCCNADGSWPTPRYIHPDCEAISVARDDPIYAEHGIRCLNYVRSLPALNTDCTFGPAEQMNQVSHFLDGSTVYGSTANRSHEIRAFDKGLLRVSVKNSREYLPVTTNEYYCGTDNSCYLAGDVRANAEPQSAVMHTLWVREHNRLVRKLAQLNPQWTDETLYQEARRIVIAEIQHISYDEWLPALVGRRFANAVGLGVTGLDNANRSTYSSYKDPSFSNEVASAALRFLVSLKQGSLSLTDDERQANDSINLSDNFYKPRAIEAGGSERFDGLVRGLATQLAQKMDLNAVAAVTHHLYKTDSAPLGLDLISIDVQRGRDHGLTGYNEYRKQCGLKYAKKFEDFLDYVPIETVNKLRSLYKHPDDVDLVIGGMAEHSVDDALLGPTFRCLIAAQFLRTRQTDRFFYDSVDQPKPFTTNQLKSLKKTSLARIFCDNGDSIKKMQPNVFVKPQKGNDLQLCEDFEKIPSIDLFAWAEKAKAYR